MDNITLDQMKNLSIDEIIRLYKVGYRIEGSLEEALNKDISHIQTSHIQNIQTMGSSTIDPFVNFGKATVSQGYDNSATTIILASGNGAIFPNPSTDGSFNLVWWNSTDYGDPSDDPNKEIVRCIASSGDTLTIARAQEGTTSSIKNLSGKTYKMVLSVTAKVFTDIQNMPAKSLHTVSGPINISGTSPSAGQILTATSPTTAEWQSLQQSLCFFVSILASPSSGILPLTPSFSSIVIGGVPPYTYLWIFGDGGTSTSPAPTHSYTANGTFTASLTLTDSAGKSAMSATTISVSTGIGLFASGLGISESVIMSDLLVALSNASLNVGHPILENIVIVDSLTGFSNASIGTGSPFLDGESIIIASSSGGNIITTDSLTGIYNLSAGANSPLLEITAPYESINVHVTQ